MLAYHALPDELSTTQLLAAAHGKQLFLPRVNGDNLEIVAYNPATLSRGAYGIQEPLGDATVGIDSIDAVIVPINKSSDINRYGFSNTPNTTR